MMGSETIDPLEPCKSEDPRPNAGPIMVEPDNSSNKAAFPRFYVVEFLTLDVNSRITSQSQ